MLQKHSPTRATALQQSVQYAPRLSRFYQLFLAQERWRRLWRRGSGKHSFRKALKNKANLCRRPISWRVDLLADMCRLLRCSATTSWRVIPAPWRLSRTCCISWPQTSPAENPPTATKQKQKKRRNATYTHIHTHTH